MTGDLQVQRLSEQLRAVDPARAVVGGRRDRLDRPVIRLDAPHGVLLQVADLERLGRHVEQLGGERLDVRGRYPRRPEIGVDVARQNVFGLD